MLPDFPKVREFADRLVMARIQAASARAEGAFAEVKAVPLHEGRSFRFTRADGSSEVVSMKRMGAAVRVQRADLEKRGVAAIIEQLDKAGSELGFQKARLFYERIGEAAKEVGHSFEGRGPFTWDTFIDALGKVLVEFDENRKPLIQIHVGTTLAKQIEENPPTEEQQRRMDEVLADRYLDFRRREGDRKLVD